MRTQFVVATIIVSLLVSGCSEKRDPIAGTDNLVARTVSQDLTIDRMGKLLGDAKIKVELTPQNGMTVVNMWTNYHRLAYAAAHNDTLESHLSAAVTPTINSERVARLLTELRAPMRHDTATQTEYDSASHGLFAVRHILFAYPEKATPLQRDSVRDFATLMLRKVTAQNFTAMAKQYSSDKQSAAQGGNLGVFPKQAMNPSVIAIIAALKPDSVSQLVPTQFGLDIVQRLSWADAKTQFVAAYSQVQKLSNDSLSSEHIAQAVKLTLTDVAIARARDAVLDPTRARRDSTVLATFDKGGRFTVSDMISWVNIMQPMQRIQVLKGMPQVPDSLAAAFVRNLAMRTVLLRAADSAKIDVPQSLKDELHAEFRKGVVQAWRELGVSPKQLADSAKTPAEREQLAARRIERVIERGMAGTLQLTPLPLPIESALDAKYQAQISMFGMQRALEAAMEIRRVADSASVVAADAKDSVAAKDTAAAKIPAARTPAPRTPSARKPAPK